MKMKQIEDFTISQFFFDIPLYHPIAIDKSNYNSNSTFQKILGFSHVFNEEFDGYNCLKKAESTFVILEHYPTNEITIFLKEGGYRRIDIKCKRYNDIFTFSIFYNVEEKYLIKIGQYPSIADFHMYKKQYDKLLSDNVLEEFTKAIDLAANGVGIGSFVYLRRIFENLILESFKEADQEKKVEKKVFNNSKMDKKIELLKDYLPPFLVENKSIYSILSKGIHELDENTCLEYFKPMKVGIEIILDQKLEKKKKKEKEEEAMKKIQQLRKEIK